MHHPRTAAIEALEARIVAHPGAVFHNWREELARGVTVWASNTKELVAHIDLGQTDEAMQIALFQNFHDSATSAEYFAKLDRYLHNALASAKSLVDQTRRYLQAYPEDSALIAGHTARTNALRAVPANEFPGDLRNYLLHYGVAPFATTTTQKDRGALSTTITLDVPVLLKSYQWKAKPKSYLLAHPEGVPLRNVIHEYSVANNEVYEALIWELALLHQGDLDDVNKLIEEQVLLQTMGAHRSKESLLRVINEGLNREPPAQGVYT